MADNYQVGGFEKDHKTYNLAEDLADFHYDVAMVAESLDSLNREDISIVAQKAVRKSMRRPASSHSAAMKNETIVYQEDIDEAAAETESWSIPDPDYPDYPDLEDLELTDIET